MRRTWAYVLGCATWYWWLLESMFPLCSFRGRVINEVWLAEDLSAAKVGSSKPLDPPRS